MATLNRSSAYPSFTIDACYKFADEIFGIFGKGDYVGVDDICNSLGKTYAGMKPKFSSAAQYGLLDKKSKSGFKPSELYYEIRIPDDESSKAVSILQCFKNAPLYKKIIGKYNGQHFPSELGLKPSMIKEWGISEGAFDTVTKVLFKNIDALNLIDSEGVFSLDITTESFDDSVDEDDLPTGVEKGSDKEESTKESNVGGNGSGKMIFDPSKLVEASTFANPSQFRESIPIFLDDQRTAYLQLPHNFDSDDLEYLLEYVQLTVKRIIKKGIAPRK